MTGLGFEDTPACLKDFHLPRPWPEDLRAEIRARLAAQPGGHKLVVLDDDPTGTQTVHDVPVLTVWDAETLRAEFAQPGPCFYVLTNSRSLAPEAAAELNREVARNLSSAATAFTVVSRSDSTLRGHFPLETDVLAEELGPFDATILIPYFEAGGRYTIGDVHYVAEHDRLVPVADTPFARDAVFGYHSSNLREWIAEKTGGRVAASEVASIGLDTLRAGGPAAVEARLCGLPAGAFCVVNAAAPRDLDVLVAGLLAAERAGRRFLFRTAAQFVAARLGLSGVAACLAPEGLSPARGDRDAAAPGGLIVVGSHVPRTTEQLRHLFEAAALDRIELDVEAVLRAECRAAALANASAQVNAALAAGRDVVLFTRRALVSDADPARSLAIGRQVSAGLVDIVARLAVLPRFLVAKGGITSSDVATRALGVRRAVVRGQIIPGVPVWSLGPESRCPGMNYVVFPGNVGGEDALLAVWRTLRAA